MTNIEITNFIKQIGQIGNIIVDISKRIAKKVRRIVKQILIAFADINDKKNVIANITDFIQLIPIKHEHEYNYIRGP